MSVADGRLGLLQLDGNAGRLALAEAEAIIAQSHFDRVAERSETEYLDLLALHQPHFQQSLSQRVAPLDALDRGPLTDLQLIKRSHQGSSWRAGGKTSEAGEVGR